MPQQVGVSKELKQKKKKKEEKKIKGKKTICPSISA